MIVQYILLDKNLKLLFRKKIISILIILLILSLLMHIKPKSIKSVNYKNLNELINKLNKYSVYREPKYILLFDYINSPVCEDLNSFTIFQYYQQHNNNDAYYVLNSKTELYSSLLKQNKTKNIIPYYNFRSNKHLFHYILNSKIIIQSYALHIFQTIVSRVKYLKFLYICHAVNYFKTSIIKIQLEKLSEDKQNIILSSPYEYKLYKKLNLYKEKSMHIGGLARFDRLQNIRKNISEKQCILISFTYRSYKKSIYDKSLFKLNINKLLHDEALLSLLEKKNIDLIYIQHHHDALRKRHLKIDKFSYVKFKTQKNLAHYIEQCSLFVTDFSSISFDFMFQNKPVLFYHLDIDDKINFPEKEFMMIDYNNSIFFNNVFTDHQSLFNKIKYYLNNNFSLEFGLSEKYKSLFYVKKNITQKIVKVINEIISNDNEFCNFFLFIKKVFNFI